MDGLIPATADDTTSTGVGVALDLAPSVSPYLQHESLSIKVEGLPPRARLSKGRNNGDHSWSLSLDELDDLLYLPPEGLHSAHSLTVRIISLDSDSASTLVQFDVPITLVDAGAAATTEATEIPSPVTVQDVDASAMDDRIAELSEELNRLRNDTIAAETTHAAETADLIARHHLELKQQVAGSEPRHAQELARQLADARAVWEVEQQARLTSAIDETAQQSEQDIRAEIERSNEIRLAHELGRQLADARVQWEADQQPVTAAMVDSAVRRAEQDVRAEIENTNEARLSQELSRQLTEARAAWETEQQDVIAAAVKQAEATIQARLEQTNEARLSLALAQRIDQQLADAKAIWEIEQQGIMTAAIQDAVQQAEILASTEMEKARLAWRDAAVQDIAELTARCTEAENGLAEATRELELAKTSPEDEAALAALRNELTSANTAIHTLETELSETRQALERASTALASQPVVSEASEEPSYREAELEFRLNEVIAEANATLAENQAVWDREREELQDRLEKNAQQRVDDAFAQWQQETQAVLAKAKQDWTDNEATRLAVAEAQWRERIGLQRSRGAVGPINQRRRRLRITGRTLRYGVIAACLVGAVMFYPQFAPLVDRKWVPDFAAYKGEIEPTIRKTGHNIGSWLSGVMSSLDPRTVIDVPSANIRSGPSRTASVIAKLPRNSAVTPLERKGNWIQISFGGADKKTGWLHVTLLKGGTVE